MAKIPTTHLLVFDFETGGLDPWIAKAEPIELAAIMLNKDTLEEVSRFEPRLMCVQDATNLNEKALSVNGKTVDQIMAAESPWTVFPQFVKWIMDTTGGAGKVMPVGHNVQFDIQFMKWAFLQYCAPIEYDMLFDYHNVCTFVLANAWKGQITKELSYFNLVSLTKHYGIPHAAHEAMGDVEATAEVLRRLYAEMGNAANALKTADVTGGFPVASWSK